ncbi:hypothetical protein [Demequina sp. SO4-18]|uniref:hypothetical protein n=1 Tax=Demequina sp. SO4-18 TaxID=3401026 RepID=UPI003B5CB2B6
MGRSDAAATWGAPQYLARNAGLPDMGMSPLGPVPLTNGHTDAIMACEDTAAVAELKAYARSYMGVGGMVIASTVATVAFGFAGKRGLAAGAAATAIASGNLVLEARRRGRQWEAVADARLASGPVHA